VARIPLSRGQFALVDASDLERVSAYKWHLKTQRAHPGKYYAQTTISLGGGKKTALQLHRFVVDATPGQIVDHINGNPLDNRRANLRFCTVRENSTNVVHSKNRKRGGFKGVTWNRNAQKWEAGIAAGPVRSNGKRSRLYLGLFVDPADAARAYDAAALKYFGDFAALNFPVAATEERSVAS
jgi:hypothetical protein